MKEKDILHESGNLWVAKINGKYSIFANKTTHSIGFLACDTLEHAIDNCNDLSNRYDLVEKLCK